MYKRFAVPMKLKGMPDDKRERIKWELSKIAFPRRVLRRVCSKKLFFRRLFSILGLD